MGAMEDGGATVGLRRDEGPNLECRMYEAKFPEIDEVVQVEVKTIAEMGAYVQLLEYNRIEGMILMSELSRRRIRSIGKLVKPGRQEVVMVLRVDKEKGYIDLSKRRVTSEDLAAMETKWAWSKMVHSILRHTADKQGMDLETLYERVAWPMARGLPKGTHVIKALEKLVTRPELLDPFGLEEPLKQELLKNIKWRLTPQAIKLRADVELTCFEYDGIGALKKALRAAEAAGTAENPVQVRLVAPPLYVMTTHTMQKENGVSVLEDAIARCRASIIESRGKITVREEPRAVTDKDEKALLAQLQRAEAENAEIAGDSDDSDSDNDTGMGGADIASLSIQ